MNKKLSNSSQSTPIPGDSEIEYVLRGLYREFPEAMEIVSRSGSDVETIIRFTSLAHECKIRREHLGKTLKDVSTDLGIPQYRIRAIESSHSAEFSQNEALLYVALLDMQPWFEKWKRMNKGAFESLPLNPDGNADWARKVARRSERSKEKR